MVKNLPAIAGDAGSISESGRYPGKEMAALYCILAWEILWTEETAKLQSMGLQKSWT